MSHTRTGGGDRLPRTNHGWVAGDDEQDEGSGEQFDYKTNDDEDEFGLPSIANTRRAARRAGGPSLELNDETREALWVESSLFGTDILGGRVRANSSDIAEERGPTYPSAKNNEGKILRPQYKDILRGQDPDLP